MASIPACHAGDQGSIPCDGEIRLQRFHICPFVILCDAMLLEQFVHGDYFMYTQAVALHEATSFSSMVCDLIRWGQHHSRTSDTYLGANYFHKCKLFHCFWI